MKLTRVKSEVDLYVYLKLYIINSSISLLPLVTQFRPYIHLGDYVKNVRKQYNHNRNIQNIIIFVILLETIFKKIKILRWCQRES